MKEWILLGNGLYIQAGIGLLGILFRYVVQACLHHMTVQTDRGNNSRNRILQQIKSRFENTYRINRGVDYMEPFVWRQLDLMRFGGIRLTTWRVLSNQAMVALLLGTSGLAIYCWQYENPMMALRYSVFGGLVLMIQSFFYLWANLGHRERELRMSLEDYLGNTYAVHLQRGVRSSRTEQAEEEMEETAFADGAKTHSPGKTEEQQIGMTQTAAAREQRKGAVKPGKPAEGNGKRVLTAEESKLIEEILQEYLN